jgi:acyl carrier protein
MQNGKKIKETREKIKEVIADALDKDASLVKEAFLLRDELKVDSFGLAELAFAIKEKLGIEVPIEDVNNIKTVADLIDYIVSKTKEE